MTDSELLESYDVMQAGMMEESCIQVDSSDNIIGPISKFIAHRGNGVLHRAFSVLLFNEDNQLLIQKRSNDKITFPGFWANTCCSHPLFVENELDSNSSRGVGNAAIRKLSQELGIDTDKINSDEFNLMGRFEYTSKSEDGWIEKEIDYVIGIHANVDIKLNVNEVSEYKWVSKDECIRNNTTIESMQKLKPAFIENGTVTAATSSPLTDGAAFTVICSEDYALKNNINPIAKIMSTAVSGCNPELMGLGPIKASQKAMKRAGIEINDLDVVELNEAFAAQSLAVLKELPINSEILNIDGGAISIGHPLGASGARIVGKAGTLLQRENGKYALATMCIGGGMGIATILEKYE